MEDKTKRDLFWLLLFFIVFINGFEAGGYQASLYTIGQNYDLSVTSMGLFASAELLATMLAPLLLGSWADRTSKIKSLSILLGIQIVASSLILFINAQSVFVTGVFFLGMTTSALQFISIATLADAYPLTGKRKIGYITSMYALGALVAPLIVNMYLNAGLSWRTLFILLGSGSIISFACILRSKDGVREELPVSSDEGNDQGPKAAFYTGAILLLCVIMCIYVGFENGFSFFVDTTFTDVLKSDKGKFALSVFWAVMIPSRIFVGYFAKKAKTILICALVAIPLVTLIFSATTDPNAAFLLCIPLGLASGSIYPCVLNIMMPFAGRKTATATGMITTATGIGGVIFTALTGVVGDRYGMRVAMSVLAAFYILSLISAILAIKEEKNISKAY